MDTYTDIIAGLLSDAADMARERFGAVSGSVKACDPNQVVTDADLDIGRMIVAALAARFPEHSVIEEETGVIDRRSPYVWVIDPVDGTSNFAAGIPAYGILIGLLYGGSPVAGGVALPSYGETYLAGKGRGATCNGIPIRVARGHDLSRMLVAYGIDSHREDPRITAAECRSIAGIVTAALNVRMSNSVVDHMMVATGKYGGYANRTSRIWDNVAPHIIIEEAGGVYTDIAGGPMEYANPVSSADRTYSFCAAAPGVHHELTGLCAAGT